MDENLKFALIIIIMLVCLIAGLCLGVFVWKNMENHIASGQMRDDIVS